GRGRRRSTTGPTIRPCASSTSIPSDASSDRYSGHVTRQLTATEVKAKILALLDEVSAGEEVEITKHGRTVARLVPATVPGALKGRFAGVAQSVAEDEDLFGTGVPWDLP